MARPGTLVALMLGGLEVLEPSAQHIPRFATTSIDLDTLSAGDTAPASFPFVNDSPDTLVLSSIVSSCGCAAIVDAARRYAPGDTGSIPVTLTAVPRSQRATSEIAVSFRSAADTTASSSRTALLRLSAPVLDELLFTPGVLSALWSRRDAAPTISGTVTNNTSRTVSVLSLETRTPDRLSVLTRQLPLDLEPGAALQFALTPQPGLTADTLRSLQSSVIVRTSATRFTRHSCAVYLYLE